MRKRFPPWIRRSLLTERGFGHVSSLVSDLHLNTVCEDAKCPNRHECWNRGTATVMILGEICTRACRFCSVRTGRPLKADLDEPRRVAIAAKSMNLKHIVVTSVDRDDLSDGGARIWADTIQALRFQMPDMSIEVLTPDFNGREDDIQKVIQSGPDVFSHNLETVQRLQPVIRPQANYGRSLAVLEYSADHFPDVAVKSGVMVGLGETEDEVYEALEDLYRAGCRLLTIGQYLQPTKSHAEIDRFVTPEEFERYRERAESIGFCAVSSGPMVRSSFRADELLDAFREKIGHRSSFPTLS